MFTRRRFLTAFMLCMTASLALAAGDHLGQSLASWKTQLGSTNRVERLLAARSIGEMAIAGDSDAADAVWAAIEHEDSAVRYWAVVAAGELGAKAKKAESSLRRALDDEAPEVRVWAGYALYRMGSKKEGMDAIVKELKNPEKGARLQAVHAIDQLGKEAGPAIPALNAVLDDEFDYVQRVARHALWVLGEQPCPYKECE